MDDRFLDPQASSELDGDPQSWELLPPDQSLYTNSGYSDLPWPKTIPTNEYERSVPGYPSTVAYSYGGPSTLGQGTPGCTEFQSPPQVPDAFSQNYHRVYTQPQQAQWQSSIEFPTPSFQSGPDSMYPPPGYYSPSVTGSAPSRRQLHFSEQTRQCPYPVPDGRHTQTPGARARRGGQTTRPVENTDATAMHPSPSTLGPSIDATTLSMKLMSGTDNVSANSGLSQIATNPEAQVKALVPCRNCLVSCKSKAHQTFQSEWFEPLEILASRKKKRKSRTPAEDWALLSNLLHGVGVSFNEEEKNALTWFATVMREEYRQHLLLCSHECSSSHIARTETNLPLKATLPYLQLSLMKETLLTELFPKVKEIVEGKYPEPEQDDE